MLANANNIHGTILPGTDYRYFNSTGIPYRIVRKKEVAVDRYSIMKTLPIDGCNAALEWLPQHSTQPFHLIGAARTMNETTASSPTSSSGEARQQRHPQRSLCLVPPLPRASASSPQKGEGANSAAFDDVVRHDFPTAVRSTKGNFYHSSRTSVPSAIPVPKTTHELELLESVSMLTLLDESSSCVSRTPPEHQKYHRDGGNTCFFTPPTNQKRIFSTTTTSKRKTYPDTPPVITKQVWFNSSRNQTRLAYTTKRSRNGSLSELQGQAPWLPLFSDLSSDANDLPDIKRQPMYLPPCFSPGIMVVATVPLRPWMRQQQQQPVALKPPSLESEPSSDSFVWHNIDEQPQQQHPMPCNASSAELLMRSTNLPPPPPIPLMATPRSGECESRMMMVPNHRSFQCRHGAAVALKMRRKEKVDPPCLYQP
jgi:hypothetical protein